MKWLGLLLLLVLRHRTRLIYKLKLKRWKAVDYEIAYLKSAGRGTGPTLVFLHGLGASKDQWGTHIYSLAGPYTCLFLDLPGEGESSFRNDQNYSPAYQVERLKAFFDAIAIKEVVLIGSSIGGCIAGLYAAAYPANVCGLVVIATAGLYTATPSTRMKLFSESGRHPFGYRNVDEMMELWAIAFNRPPKVPVFLAKALAAKGERRYLRVEKILRDFHVTGLYPLQARLTDIQARTLFLWGRNDQVFDVSCIEDVSKLLPEARIFVIDDVGHVPYLECGDQTLETIQKFLDQCHTCGSDEQAAAACGY